MTHHTAIDSAAVGAVVSAPWWLPLFNMWGQAVLILSGLILMAWRYAIAFQHWRAGKRSKARKELGL